MNYILSDREPKDALRYFEELSAIPRGSKNEKAAAEYLMNFAKEQGLWAHMDHIYNVIIKKPASPGCEHLSPVMLQGHTDIVCEKNNDVDFDFEKDGIRLVLDGDKLHADGTTLGADNGTAVSWMMAILSRKDLVHPPLECVFTSQEEIGLLGARELDPNLLSARRLLNLDVGPEGVAVAGSAGGRNTKVFKDVKREPVSGKVMAVRVRGLQGGHSGSQIDKERGNSNKIMGRLLHDALKVVDLRILSVEGGAKENAIPRECDCVFAVAEADVAKVTDSFKAMEARIQGELEHSDAGFHLVIEDATSDLSMMDKQSSYQLAELLYLLPNGLIAKSMALPDLTVTSLNMGVVETQGDTVVITYSIRSSDDSLMDEVEERLETIANLFDVRIDSSMGYPSWRYVTESKLREQCMQVYKEVTGKEMIVRAGHGGLECGIFKDFFPDIDIVALGCNSVGAHTPQETLDLVSYARFFDFLVKTLEYLTTAD